jgi:hypothetical protein
VRPINRPIFSHADLYFHSSLRTAFLFRSSGRTPFLFRSSGRTAFLFRNSVRTAFLFRNNGRTAFLSRNIGPPAFLFRHRGRTALLVRHQDPHRFGLRQVPRRRTRDRRMEQFLLALTLRHIRHMRMATARIAVSIRLIHRILRTPHVPRPSKMGPTSEPGHPTSPSHTGRPTLRLRPVIRPALRPIINDCAILSLDNVSAILYLDDGGAML